ncbi:hypothetical protein PTSG_04094 [Salpingoeca rosetta]|uniref:Renin receptor-like C-terminal transmembrane spanning segment domain-containing protein n=1 Tax=Salpingoeca rosetta (strain ATCC 50818 / BSB-021) TaxID=946362 RepID=F2U6K4_SALR5|nr:uncharacterized protein PTSG_04094 [Salpingoeca rosetta]EGD83486.1 hypothetical protein PTSG_04094 [Salpingoeca rosetta]|eukprot:XP_004994990.1 hypothetical protein PTSG_04094 [Salpingoeca rosetta]
MRGSSSAAVCALLLAVVASLQAAPSSAATLAFVKSPSFIDVNTNAPLLSQSQVDDVVKASLGLNTDTVWAGVSRTSPFDVPSRTLHVTVSGCDQECIPEASEALFNIMPQEYATSTSSKPLATHVSAAFGADSLVTPATTQLSVTEVTEILNNVQGVRVSEMAIIVGDEEPLDASSPLASALANIITAANTVVAAQTNSPRVIVETIDMSAIPAESQSAAAALVRATIAHASALLAQDGSSALTTMACSASGADVSARVMRRSLNDVGTLHTGIVPNNANLTPSDPAWVEHCKEYKCFCATDADGNPWDPKTRCKADCDPEKGPCDCVYLGCDCKTGANVMKTQSKCIKCKEGFVVIGNHCYLESDMPVAVNINLWLGLLLLATLLLTCFSLGNMDPGYDSIIYRMTQQRIKAQ